MNWKINTKCAVKHGRAVMWQINRPYAWWYWECWCSQDAEAAEHSDDVPLWTDNKGRWRPIQTTPAHSTPSNHLILSSESSSQLGAIITILFSQSHIFRSFFQWTALKMISFLTTAKLTIYLTTAACAVTLNKVNNASDYRANGLLLDPTIRLTGHRTIRLTD